MAGTLINFITGKSKYAYDDEHLESYADIFGVIGDDIFVILFSFGHPQIY